MKIHEYQAKELLRKYGVVTPRGFHCISVDAAVKAAEDLGGKVWVVKAQIHAGGRGTGGGVKLARSLDEVRQHANDILGMQHRGVCIYSEESHQPSVSGPNRAKTSIEGQP